MSKLSTAITLFKDNKLTFISALIGKISFLFPDKLYLQLQFRLRMGYRLNLKTPKSFSEKIQWLKLYNRNPLYTTLVDKYAVKKWVADKIGEDHVIPTLGVWENADDIDFDKLPNQFVLKTTNGGGGDVIICRDKSNFDKKKAINHLNNGLKRSLYKELREWQYKHIPPRIIAEKYMEDESGELRDYKFFCFDGIVKALFIASDRLKVNEDTKFDFFDRNFNHLPITNGHPNAKIQPQKPKMYEKMISLAEKLSSGIPHVRVDLYEIDDKIYFGEMTFSHHSGMCPFCPIEWDYKFGEWLQLPSKRIQ
ncbi:ATP-grasp fold amidoligase family protein [Fibrobacter sp. UBA4297]|uniref:ATP-grasp fold amidoligase family protein n=1 Tax=Fibrobacter sp. UBA4297 TaxID=1946536 RepID=UPI0025BE3EA4|nr:ATP-grasp fold amidoligase family protein [Fibrobacter sp. UBA4297]